MGRWWLSRRPLRRFGLLGRGHLTVAARSLIAVITALAGQVKAPPAQVGENFGRRPGAEIYPSQPGAAASPRAPGNKTAVTARPARNGRRAGALNARALLRAERPRFVRVERPRLDHQPRCDDSLNPRWQATAITTPRPSRRMTGQFPPAGPGTPRQRALHTKGGHRFPASPRGPAALSRRTVPPLAARSGRRHGPPGALATSQQDGAARKMWPIVPGL